MSINKYLLGILVLLAPAILCGQTFNDYITRLNIAPLSERPAIVDSFMNAAGSFPFIEGDTLTHFIYRGNASAVNLAGDQTGWDPAGHSFTFISGTDFWYLNADYESDARLDYKFVLPGNTWILDALNPYTCAGGFGPNSELRMPQYVPAPEINYYPAIPHGSIQDTMFFSSNLNNTRRIRVYLPPGYSSSTEDYPLMLFHDGLEYITLANADRVLDYLINEDQIEPVIGVFVPPVNREEEYAGNLQNEFGLFITEEVLPWVDGSFRTLAAPEERATLGASNGGNIALWLGVTYPEQFGKIAAQSSNVESNITNVLQNDPIQNLEFYLDIGTYDIQVLIPMVNNLADLLQARGYPYQFNTYHEGHSWGNWRAHIDNALIQFFPGPVNIDSPIPSLPTSVELLGNYPNPFNPSTTIRFTLPSSSHATVSVFDLTGRLVTKLADEVFTAGEHALEFDGSGLSSGIYFARLQMGEVGVTKKMVMVK
jgi:enterochelin esterase-like enzyme